MNKIIFVITFFNFFLSLNCLNLNDYCEYEQDKNGRYSINCSALTLDYDVRNIEVKYEDNWKYFVYSFNCYNCEIPLITRNIFSDEISEINFSDCKIKAIEDYAFKSLNNLRSVHLPNNLIEELVAFTFSEISNDEYQRVHIDVSHNKIANIEDFCFKNPQITGIDLSHNFLKVVKNNTFGGATTLEVLRLENNLIQNIENASFFDQANLRELYLNNNKLKIIESGTFTKTNSLVHLNLANNIVDSVERNFFFNMPYLKVIDLSNNKLKKIKSGTFCYSRSLTELRLNNNLIQCIEDNSVCGKTMTLLNLGNNSLTVIKNSTFDKLKSLRTIYLDNNLIENIEKGSFLKNSELDAIYLNNNKLKEFDDEYVGYISEISSHIDLSNNILESVHFGNKHKLDTLNLSSGNIKDLHYDAFEGLDLKTLILTDNKIEKFDMHVIYPMSNLSTLYIDGNKLSEIDYEDPKFTISFIDLTYNNWNCTYLEKLIKYLNGNSITYIVSKKPNTTLNVAGIGCAENNENQKNHFENQNKYSREDERTTISPRTNNNLENSQIKPEVSESSKEIEHSVKNAIDPLFFAALGMLGILIVSMNIWMYIFYKNKIRPRTRERTLVDHHSLIDMKDMQ